MKTRMGTGGVLAAAGVVGALVALRFWKVGVFPVVGVDEGIWNFEARDLLLFGERSMNGFNNVFLSPLHFATCWLLFHVAPATCFSVRVFMGILGLVALGLVGVLVQRHRDRRTAFTAVLLIGFSFVMITVNRRAYLEGAMIVMSPVALLLAEGRSRGHRIAFAVCVAGMLAYKSAAVYLLPALLIPAVGETRRLLAQRLVSVVVGVALAITILFLVARSAPELSGPAMLFELSKSPGPEPLVRVGRFGVSLSAVGSAFRDLIVGQTDLAVLSGIAAVGFLALRGWRDRFALRVMAWLLCGYAFFLAQPNHPQYFAPLIVPAGILAALVTAGAPVGVRRWAPALLVASVTVFSLLRLGSGYRESLRSNPPAQVLAWLEQQGSGASSYLAAPEVVIASPRRGYAFNRIFHPLPPLVAPPLIPFLRTHGIRYIIFDQWETAVFFADDPRFHAALARFDKVAAGDGWVAFDTRAVIGARSFAAPVSPRPHP